MQEAETPEPRWASLARGDLEKGGLRRLSKRSSFGKPDIRLVEIGRHRAVHKDIRGKSFLVRHILGAWLIEREYRIYQQLEGCPGVPRLYGRPDRWSFVVEYIDGRSLERRDPELQDPAFFCRLHRLIETIHARGIVHLDLRHKGNIMISQDGTPYIIDFNSGIYLGGNALGRRLLPWFKKVDWAGLLKLKQRVAPELLSAEELSRLKWFGFIRKFWIFN